jgi:hypothetical protein
MPQTARQNASIINLAGKKKALFSRNIFYALYLKIYIKNAKAVCFCSLVCSRS